LSAAYGAGADAVGSVDMSENGAEARRFSFLLEDR